MVISLTHISRNAANVEKIACLPSCMPQPAAACPRHTHPRLSMRLSLRFLSQKGTRHPKQSTHTSCTRYDRRASRRRSAVPSRSRYQAKQVGRERR
eukprot:508975-Rhodomonas_salina.2